MLPVPPPDSSLTFSIATIPLPLPGLRRFSARGYFAGLHFAGQTIAFGPYQPSCRIVRFERLKSVVAIQTPSLPSPPLPPLHAHVV